ncbi:hypothetical protein GGS21DRAFT_493591 [Xylaria nigripes]|nr:hypothetical protein GGS21DRAFT_493591 [Xylaria nigripes]
MPPASYSLEEYDEKIRAWVAEGYTQSQICALLQPYCKKKPDCRTLRRYLEKQGITKHKRLSDVMTPTLVAAIQFEFFKLNNSDSAMLQKLHAAGHSITARQLRSVRQHLGLKRRISTSAEKENQLMECRAWFAMQFEKSNRLADYGRGYLYDYAKDDGQQFSRDTIFEIYKEFRPEIKLRHYWQEKRRKGEFIVYGPNQVWSIDGHDKLKRWGIHIYGGIDGYSRFMIWCHVGYFGSTALTTMKQYLRVVHDLGYVPRVIRADRGKEVPLLAAAHWALVRQSHMNEDGSPILFGDCFHYGRSMDNTRIEHWWSQLLKTCLMRWIVLFERMEHRRLWIHGDEVCEIAFLSVYMPVIRQEITFFIRRWNSHKIRAQPNRANCVKGRPFENYFTPDPAFASQWGLPVDVKALSEIENLLEDVDIDQYLPQSTLEWCEEVLSTFGLDRTREDDAEWPFTSYYNQLRTAVQQHIDQGNQTGLHKASKPVTGGLAELKRRMTRIGNFESVALMEHEVQAENHILGEQRLNFENAAPE